MVRSGLIGAEEILDTKVIHEEYGYAIFDLGYTQRQERVRSRLARYGNLHSLGRAAQFRHLELEKPIKQRK